MKKTYRTTQQGRATVIVPDPACFRKELLPDARRCWRSSALKTRRALLAVFDQQKCLKGVNGLSAPLETADFDSRSD